MKICLFAVHKIDEGYWCLSWWLIWASCFFDRCLSKVSASVVWQKDGFSWYWYLYFDLQQASVLPERRLDVLGVMQMGQQVKSLIISWSLVPWDSPGTPGLVPTKLDWGEALASSRHLLRRRSKLHMRDGSVQQVGLRGSHGISGAQKDLETCQGLGQSRSFVHWLWSSLIIHSLWIFSDLS